MDLRTTGSRDERRRRVLIDDAQAEPALGETSPPTKKTKSESGGARTPRYSRESLDRGQPRIVDLLPKRRLTLWVWLLAGTVVISALIALDVAVAGWSSLRPEIDWSLLRLDARGSLASWVAAMTLAWAGFAGLQIYLIRRHRADDYRGGYRLWSTAAIMLTIASADAATSLHVLAGQFTGSLLGVEEFGAEIGLGLVCIAGLGLGARIVWELKPSRGSLATMAMAAACYLAAILSSAGLIDSPPVQLSFAGAAALCGHAFVFLTVGVFGRYVFLEAHDQLPPRVRRKQETGTEDLVVKKRVSRPKGASTNQSGVETRKRGRTDVDGPDSTEAKRTDPARSSETDKKPAPGASPAPKIAGKTPAAMDEEEDDDQEESPRLSKAERRRLRKQQQRKAA